MGSSSSTTLLELIVVADHVLSSADIRRPDAIATLGRKRGDPLWEKLATHYRCRLLFFDAARLEMETPRISHSSEAVFKMVGCHSVAEAAALAGAGPDSILRVEKTTHAHVTAALAVHKGENF
ncbi:cobalamin biosynthesis protein [Brucella sp. BE17]|uniref:cobalamin biosynthesis protein n=1 Tax=Brucella sp. BE17 TaxID=3142977 RepID=UPI0031BA6FBE